MKNAVLFAVASLLLTATAAGCMQIGPPVCSDGETVLLDASLPDSDDYVRSSMDGGFSVRWDSSDEISVLGASTASKGTVSSISSNGKGAVFRVTGVRDRELHAVHPYVAPGLSGAPVLENGKLRISVPECQDGTFSSAHICAAYSGGNTVFAFRNVASLVQFSVSDPSLASSAATAVLSAVAGENVAGSMLLDSGFRCRWPSSTASEITIPMTGVTAGTDIWAAVLPGDYARGFRVRLLDCGGTLLKSFDCGIGMTLGAGRAVRMGDVGHITGMKAQFVEKFGGCKKGSGEAISRINADEYCDNPGWDFGMCSVSAGCVQFTSPKGLKSWAMTPPLGIEGCASIAVKADRSRVSTCGMAVEVCGPGHVKGNLSLWATDYGTISDTVMLCGLSRDTRLKLTPTSSSVNSTRLFEVSVIPGGEPFPYLELPMDEVVLPPEAGKYVYMVEHGGLQGSMCCYMGQFRDPATYSYLVDENGKALYPIATFRMESGKQTGRLTVSVPENRSGVRRSTSVDIYCSNACESLKIIQDPYEE